MIVCIFFSACTIWGINIDSSKCQNKKWDENIESWNRVPKKIECTSAVHYDCFEIFFCEFCSMVNMIMAMMRNKAQKGPIMWLNWHIFLFYITMVNQYYLGLILGIPWFVLYCYSKSCRIWMMILRNEVWIEDVRIYHTCCCC